MIDYKTFVCLFIMVSMAGCRFLYVNVVSAIWFILSTIACVELFKYWGGS